MFNFLLLALLAAQLLAAPRATQPGSTSPSAQANVPIPTPVPTCPGGSDTCNGN